MNQKYSRSGFRNEQWHEFDYAQHHEPLQRLRQQLEDYSLLNKIRAVLSPYWTSRSGS